jgi:hypothetical protein
LGPSTGAGERRGEGPALEEDDLITYRKLARREGSQTTTSLPTFLGVQLDARYSWANGMMWSPFVRVA